MFTIPAASVSLAGLTVANGYAGGANLGGSGGGIYNGSGRLTLDGVVFTRNVAAGAEVGSGGGALYSAGATVIRNSIFLSNRASGVRGSGGAIMVAGASLELREGELKGNTANRAGGAIEASDTKVTVSGSTLFNNSTGQAPGNGGALHLSGASSALIVGARITDNRATSQGGGIWNSARGTLILDGTYLSGNVLPNGGRGGAIYNDGGLVSLRDCPVANNRAGVFDGSGGAIFNSGAQNSGARLSLSGCVLRFNSCGSMGGAIATVGRTSCACPNFVGGQRDRRQARRWRRFTRPNQGACDCARRSHRAQLGGAAMAAGCIVPTIAA